MPPTRPENPVIRGTDEDVVVMNVEELLTIDEDLKDEKLVDLTNEVLDNVVEEETMVGWMEDVVDEELEELFSEDIVEDGAVDEIEREGDSTILENNVKRRRSPQISALFPGHGIAQSVEGAGTLPCMRESPQ